MLLFIIPLLGIFLNEAPQDSMRVFRKNSVVQIAHLKTNTVSASGILTVKRIFIVGNNVTHDRVILRELTCKSGDTVYRKNLQRVLDLDKKKLINTRLFNGVEIKALELGDGEVDLLIHVNERWYTFPSPIFDLTDRNFNEWWQNYDHDISRVNYGLKLDHFNMRGRNETLSLTAQFGFERRLALRYHFPVIDQRQKQGVTINFDFSETKNLAYKTVDHKLQFLYADNVLKSTRGGGLTYTYRNSFYNSHAIRIDYRSITLSDTVIAFNPEYFRNKELKQQYGSISYRFTSDHRDYLNYPLSGHYFTIVISKFGINSSRDLNKIEVSASLTRYFTMKRDFYLSSYVAAYWSTPEKISYSNFGALGYSGQIVRGYEIYVIEGPIFFVNKTTFKKLIFSRKYRWAAMPIDQFKHLPFSIYLKTYADAGYVKSYSNHLYNSRLTNKFIYGGGTGIDLVGSYDIVISLEYTLNAEGNHGFFINLRKEF